MKTFHMAMLTLLLAAAGGLHTAAAKTLRWASDGDVSAMDPNTRLETVQMSFLSNIYEPLFRFDPDLKLEPALATKWEQTGFAVWRFHLRPGVKWQNGSPFTADDVVFSLHRIMSKTSIMRSVMSMVKEVRKIDDLTVDFETFEPDPIFLRQQTSFLIMSKAWCEQHHATEPVVLGGSKDNYAVRNAMGTGPFRLVSREPDRKTVVERNLGWWDTPRHNLDAVELYVIGNAATRVAALLSGEMDIIYSVPPQAMDRIAGAPHLKLLQRPETRTLFVGLDQWRDELPSSDVKGRNPFKDVRVRRALALAIDGETIAKRIMLGVAHPTWMLWGPGVNGYNPELDLRPKTSLAEARMLLAEAGYANGFRVGFDCPNDRYVMDEQICTAVTVMLAQIGVKADPIVQTKAKFFAKIQGPKFDTDMYLLGWSPVGIDAHNVLYALFGTRDGTRGEFNDGGYSSPKLDGLIEHIRVESDEPKRQALIDEAARLLQDDVAAIPLHQQVIVWAAKKDVELAQSANNAFPYRYVRMP